MKKSIVILVAYALALFMQSVLRRFDWYAALYHVYPFYVPETIKSVLGIVLCAAVSLVIYKRVDNFGFAGRLPLAIGFGFVCSLPMVVGLAATRSVGVVHAVPVVFLAGLFPLTEEMLSRGFAFRLLYREERWPLWAAITVVALITGGIHIEKGQSVLEVFGLFALTGIGGGLFSWLFARWQSLWFPFALHMFMNLWWEVFTVSRTALGGWFPLSLQVMSLVLAVVCTVRCAPALTEIRDAGTRRGNSRINLLLRRSTVPI